MVYQRSLEIEGRLEDVLRLIRTGRYSAPSLTDEVGVSMTAISRRVMALRERAHDIREKNRLWLALRAPRETKSAKGPGRDFQKDKPIGGSQTEWPR